MSQHVGAILDKLLLIGFGLFASLAPQRFVSKSSDSEEAKKRILIVRVCGTLALICGVVLLLMLL